VWQKAHGLTLEIYAVTRPFPREELFGLTSHLRRACVSIGANIAEGCGRAGNGELSQFLSIARGSASEVEYHLLVARDLGYLPLDKHAELQPRIEEIKRMLAALLRRTREPPN
jgi:four helix bundle protein